jgi:hypothetical protein
MLWIDECPLQARHHRGALALRILHGPIPPSGCVDPSREAAKGRILQLTIDDSEGDGLDLG